MPTRENFDHYYKVLSGTPGGTLTLATSTSRGGGAPFVVNDGADGNPNGQTAVGQNAHEGPNHDLDSITITFHGFTSDGDPIFFFSHSSSFFNGYRVYSNNDYPANHTIGSTVTGPYLYCFAADTMIATPKGERRVDALAIGDVVTTQDGAKVPVRWIGRQVLYPGYMGEKSAPVRIAAGALGNNIPHSALTVTADHGMIIDGLVINASALVNGDTIRFVPVQDLPNQMTVYHVETEAHDVILANGAAAETFIDAADRKSFDNFAEYLDLYGVERIIPEMPHPRISSARLVPADIRARLGIPNHSVARTG